MQFFTFSSLVCLQLNLGGTSFILKGIGNLFASSSLSKPSVVHSLPYLLKSLFTGYSQVIPGQCQTHSSPNQRVKASWVLSDRRHPLHRDRRRSSEHPLEPPRRVASRCVYAPGGGKLGKVPVRFIFFLGANYTSHKNYHLHDF